MRSTSRCAVSLSCPIELTSADSAGSGLGRARAESWGGVLFRMFARICLVYVRGENLKRPVKMFSLLTSESTRFRAIKSTSQLVRCFLVVPGHARLFRLWRGWPWLCWCRGAAERGVLYWGPGCDLEAQPVPFFGRVPTVTCTWAYAKLPHCLSTRKHRGLAAAWL